MPRKKKPFIRPSQAVRFELVAGESEGEKQLNPIPNRNRLRKMSEMDSNEEYMNALRMEEAMGFAHPDASEDEDDYEDSYTDSDEYIERAGGPGPSELAYDDGAEFAISQLVSSYQKEHGKVGKKKNAAGGKRAVDAGYDLGEYGFEDDGYDYSQHFKSMGEGFYISASGPRDAKLQPDFRLKEDSELSDEDDLPPPLEESSTSRGPEPSDSALAELATQGPSAASTDQDGLATNAFGILVHDFETHTDEEIDEEILAELAHALEHPDLYDPLEFTEEQTVEDYGGLLDHRFKHAEEEDHEGEEAQDGDEEDEGDELEDLPPPLEESEVLEGSRQELEAHFDEVMGEYDDDYIGDLEGLNERVESKAIAGRDVDKWMDEELEMHRAILAEYMKRQRQEQRHRMTQRAIFQGRRDKEFQERDALIRTALVERLNAEAETYDDEADEEAAMEFVEMLSQRDRDEHDAKSITSTYTNTENHPAVIRPQALHRKKKPAEPKPVALPDESKPLQEEEAVAEDLEFVESVAPARRPKGESAEEKKIRKQAVKSQRRQAREHKKELREAYKSEELRVRHATSHSGTSSVISYQ